jgi:hypothetical protein
MSDEQETVTAKIARESKEAAERGAVRGKIGGSIAGRLC